MRALLVLLGTSLLVLAAAPRDAEARGRHHHHGHHHRHSHYGGWGPRVSIGVWPGYYYGWQSGIWLGAPVYPYPVYARPYPYAYPYYAGAPERVIVDEPPVYVERDDAPPDRSWYYCESRRAYYPKVDSCPEPWVPVPARD